MFGSFDNIATKVMSFDFKYMYMCNVLCTRYIGTGMYVHMYKVYVCMKVCMD